MGKFIVRLTNEFSAISGAARRFRAGLEIPVGGEVEADLDKEQLAELHEDQYVTVHDAKTGKVVTPKDTTVQPLAISTEAENAQAAVIKPAETIVEDVKAANDAAAPSSEVLANQEAQAKLDAKAAKADKKA
ncbi:hypothetical protein [Nakamurella sp. PAMC28650]|uniref:hypothetical protein n=1 Tax=Nakamurella sp. PAMC28650 TaxID=2762325 RepID=UPI00164DA67F|nr:hypothetical protein [Nakamurella sp. PAMC28650]QNK82593.1 hypothetical protein H7F38_07765 [Nakamurella sp. PAMC28650]